MFDHFVDTTRCKVNVFCSKWEILKQIGTMVRNELIDDTFSNLISKSPLKVLSFISDLAYWIVYSLREGSDFSYKKGGVGKIGVRGGLKNGWYHLFRW